MRAPAAWPGHSSPPATASACSRWRSRSRSLALTLVANPPALVTSIGTILVLAGFGSRVPARSREAHLAHAWTPPHGNSQSTNTVSALSLASATWVHQPTNRFEQPAGPWFLGVGDGAAQCTRRCSTSDGPGIRRYNEGSGRSRASAARAPSAAAPY